MRSSSLPLIAALLLAANGCSSSSGGNSAAGGSSTGGSLGVGGAALGSGGAAPGSGGAALAFGGSNASAGSTGSAGACASQSAKAEVEPVYLVFAFDVSGSMGEGDKPWHDKTLKWDPVVAASKAFLEDPGSKGLNASMTFFPASSKKCDKDTYTDPDVEMQALPSSAFGKALDKIGDSDWRGGTPTLYVMQGTIEFVRAEQEKHPGRYVIVLVTDGYPQSCDDNEISSVVDVASGVATTIPTYVIGVKNPPLDGAPDTVSDLDAIAVAGQTEHAYIIDTGNPADTATTFKATIDTIRSQSISCDVPIPTAPDGRTFDKQKVVVTYRSGDTLDTLVYDSECKRASAWHYDDLAAPKQISLCPETCNEVQSDAQAALNVEFTCETQVDIPR